jgi:hypothetical protein
LIVTYDDFSNDPRYESFGTLDEGLVQVYLYDAIADCAPSVWRNPTTRIRAVKLLVAHRLTLASQAGEDAVLPGFASGQMTSLSTSQGSNSASFSPVTGIGSTGDELLMLTIYGQEFLRLRRSLPTVGFVV